MVNRDSTVSPEEQTKQVLSIYPVVDGQKLNADLAIPPRKEDDGQEGDLIDISSSDAPAQPAGDKKPTEIEHMLNSTGKPAEGALIDFADDMKKDLPTADAKP